MEDLNVFFKKLGIKPRNINLYEMAFTHSSINSDGKKHHDYQRLEFMGDSVLGFVVASLIYKYHPEMDEGKMTKTKATLVQTKFLANKANELNYPKFIRFGACMTEEDIKNNAHILEDIFEAVIGAVYVDQGIIFAEKFVTKIFEKDVKEFVLTEVEDYKSALQEAMQAEYRESVSYSVVSETGPAHNKSFEIVVKFNDQVLGRGCGRTKKAAEQEAAKDALSKVAK